MLNLTPVSILLGALRLGINNTLTILSAGTLWLLTLWIPYTNIGSSIGMLNLVATIGRDENFRPTDIFNREYRANIGEFLLLLIMIISGVMIGLLLGILPGILVYFAWSQAFLLMEAHNLSPMEAIRASNHITYGNKWNMFVGMTFIQVILAVTFGSLLWAFQGHPIPTALTALCGYCCYLILTVGAFAHIFSEFEHRYYHVPAKDWTRPGMHAFA